MITPHLNAKEYYVQKGVGWTIRETYNVYPVETIKFIDDNIHKIHAHAWYASSEKLPRKLKDKLVEKRRYHRKSLK